MKKKSYPNRRWVQAKCISLRFCLLGISLLLSSSFLLTKFDFSGQYECKGDTAVKARSLLGYKYEKTFHPTFSMHIASTNQSRQYKCDITHKGHTFSLQGIEQVEGMIIFIPNQTTKQVIEGSSFIAKLNATLLSGSLRKENGILLVNTDWSIKGNVKIWGIPVPLTGTMRNEASAPIELQK